MLTNLQQLPEAVWFATFVLVVAVALFIIYLRRRKFTLTELTAKTPIGDAKFAPEDSKSASSPAAPPPITFGNAQADGNIQQVGTVRGDIIQADTVIQRVDHVTIAPAPLPPPLPRDALPTLNCEKYIPRGIEADVCARLRQDGAAAIVGIHAPGGVGKTELAKSVVIEIAKDFDAWKQMDLGRKTPDEIIGDLALACGITLAPNADYRQRVQELRAGLRSRKILFILDDVREANRAALDDFLPPPLSAAIVTSRIQTLSQKIRANALFTLENMTDGQAHELLQAALGKARVQAEPDAAAIIITRCMGNPLMLDIAAHCILQFTGRKQPLAFYAQKLVQRLDALQAGDDPRLSWEKVFDLSYDELTQTDQRRFRALSVFSEKGFGIPATQFVWNDSADDAARVIAHLRDLSLIKIVEAQDERYRLHDLLDEYAEKKLRASGETDAVNDRHARYLVQLFEEHYTDDPSTAPEILLELENLRAAVRWARAARNGERLAQLATKPRNWMVVLNWYGEWYEWLRDVLRIGIDGYDQRLQANVLKAMGDVQQFRDDRDTALQSYAQALELFRAVGSKLGEANVFLALGGSERTAGRLKEARAHFQTALETYKSVGDGYSQARALYRLGDCTADEKDWKSALQAFRQAAEIWQSIGLSNLVAEILEPRIANAEAELKKA